eukprot:1349642-Amorphochlora_amoeboformis.AAC.1
MIALGRSKRRSFRLRMTTAALLCGAYLAITGLGGARVDLKRGKGSGIVSVNSASFCGTENNPMRTSYVPKCPHAIHVDVTLRPSYPLFLHSSPHLFP